MDKITVKHISENEIQEKGIRTWSTWSCDKSEFPWEYSERESCYIVEGQVEVTTKSGDTVSFGPGDFIISDISFFITLTKSPTFINCP